MSLLQNNTDALNRLRRCSREELEAVFGSMEPSRIVAMSFCEPRS